MKSYHVSIKVQNNYLLHQMDRAGISSAWELSKAAGVHPTLVYKVLNLTIPLLTTRGHIVRPIERLAAFLKCLPEDLFPPEHVREALKKNKADLKMDAADVQDFIAHMPMQQPRLPGSDLDREQQAARLRGLLGDLTQREERFVRMHFGLDGGEGKTFREIGDQVGLSVERVRQIVLTAMRKLRHPSRLPALMDIRETVCGLDD